MRLYYHQLSSNSRRVLLTAHHLGIALDLIPVDLAHGEHKSPDFLRLNPTGRIPVLVDGDFVLWESHAIMQYLADQAPDQDIYPRDIAARADVNRWLFWSANHFAPAAALIIRERVSKALLGGEADLVEIARGEAAFSAAARDLNDHLACKQWVTQARLTLADFALAAPLMHAAAAALPLASLRELEMWFARIRASKAWADANG